MALKLHPSYITDIQSLGPELSDLWLRSDVPMYYDSELTLQIDNPCSMEVINLADIRFMDRPAITILDKDGYELYVTQAIAVDEPFGTAVDTVVLDGKYLPTSGGTVYGKVWMNGAHNNQLLLGAKDSGGIINFARGVDGVSTGAIGFSSATDHNTFGIYSTGGGGSVTISNNGVNTVWNQTGQVSFGATLSTVGAITEAGTLLSSKYVNQAVQYTNPTWLAGIDASIIKTGTIDLARLPALPSSNTIVCTTIPAMSAGDQLLVAKGTVVIESTTGNTYRYTGTGSVVLNASYIQQSDLTPDWAVITNRPTNVSTWSNDAGYLTNSTGDGRYLRLAGGQLQGRLNLYKSGAVATLRSTHGFGFGDDYTGLVSFWGSEANAINALGTAGAGAADGPFLFGYRGVSLGYSSVGLTNGDLVAALRTDNQNVIVAGTITEGGSLLSAKYAAKTHTHAWADITSGKPTTLAGYGITDAADSAHTHTFTSLTSKPTTLAGYGITDAAGSTHTHTFASLTSKPTTLSGYGITDAVGSSDSRLTDARTPLAHTHTISSLTEGVTFANGAWNTVGDDVRFGDINEGATLGLTGANSTGTYLRFCANNIANASAINSGYKLGYNGTDFVLLSGATQIVRTDSNGVQYGRGFEGYVHNGVGTGTTGNTYGGQWLALCTLTVTGRYGSASATFDVSNAYGTGTSGNWYSYKGTIKIKQQSLMGSTLDMCKLHIINCEGSYNPWTQLVAVLVTDTAVEKRVVLYAQSPWAYDSIRLKVENTEGNVLHTGIGAWTASLPAGTQYTGTNSIRFDSNDLNKLHVNDNLYVGWKTGTGTNNVGRIASNLNSTSVASFIGNWNSNGNWGIAGSYVANDYRIRIVKCDAGGTVTDWANLGAGTISSHNVAEMSKWGINGAYAFFGLAGGNTTSWATSNGVGVGAGEIWLSNPTRFRIAIGTKTDALNMSSSSVSFGMPVYSTEFHSTGSYAGTGLFAGTGDGASLTTYNHKITSWYGTGIYDACNNVCTGYIDNRLGKLYLKGDIVTEKWVYAAKFVGPIDASGGPVTVGSLTGTAGAYFTNGCSAAFFTSGVSTISTAGSYLGSNYNNIIAVTVAGVTVVGTAQGRVQHIVNTSGSTVAFNMAGGGYYYAGSATTGTVTIPSKRTLVIIPVASTTDVYTYLL